MPDMFSVLDGFKQAMNFSLEYTSRKVQESQKELKLKGTNHTYTS
jgi:hypothetical protein